MKKFYNDLMFAEKYELLVPTIIENDGYERCNNKDYDIMLKHGDVNKYYEVKCDRLMHKTNNICIEFECFGKPSGITTSKSDYYVYFELLSDDKHNVYIIPTKRIKKRIAKQEYKRTLCGGDNKASKFYLFDKNIFKKYLV